MLYEVITYQVEQKTTDIALDLQGHAQAIRAEIEEFIEELQYELKIARETVALLRGQPAGQIDTFLNRITSYNVCYTKLLRRFWRVRSQKPIVSFWSSVRCSISSVWGRLDVT